MQPSLVGDGLAGCLLSQYLVSMSVDWCLVFCSHSVKMTLQIQARSAHL